MGSASRREWWCPTPARQLVVFAAVGAVGTGAHYLVLVFLVQKVGFGPALATTIGFAIGAIVNYALNRRVTFSSKASHVQAATKFVLVALIGAVLNLSVMWVAIRSMSMPYMLAQVLATGGVLVFNFALSRAWVFRS